jgi:mRNA-degrading endonuclease RelE of RelBE toxin-antitoxin system
MWTVIFSGRAQKRIKKLPDKVSASLKLLIRDLQFHGPVLRQWPNFGDIVGRSGCYHCHLKKGRPTFVAVWKVIDREIRLIEVRYVGTHEGADYERIC